ncbi:MAG TPA: PLD nuclease N-terminal domain-containing protein [Acidimicrobiales bacterium]|nr:PLD nuclease N-terminal domain-containing protein [Acidimicrobiales bacterium]
MIRILGPGIFGLVALGLWLYCIFDVIATEEMLVRNLPKTLWLLLVIFVPTVGGLAWLLLGRPLNAGWRPGDTELRRPPRIRGPEDDPDW